jgi:hypothetical protein
MIPSPAVELLPPRQPLPRAGSTTDPDGGANVFAALLEALNTPERYRLVQRDGEIFIEPAS